MFSFSVFFYTILYSFHSFLYIHFHGLFLLHFSVDSSSFMDFLRIKLTHRFLFLLPQAIWWFSSKSSTKAATTWPRKASRQKLSRTISPPTLCPSASNSRRKPLRRSSEETPKIISFYSSPREAPSLPNSMRIIRRQPRHSKVRVK